MSAEHKRSEQKEYKFEDHIHPGSKLSKAFISIIGRGGFSLSSGLVHAEELERFDFVVVGYDGKYNVIRFKFNNTRELEGNIGIVKHKGAFVIPTVSFFTWFGLDPKTLAGRYELDEIDASRGIYMLDLNLKLEPLLTRGKTKES